MTCGRNSALRGNSVWATSSPRAGRAARAITEARFGSNARGSVTTFFTRDVAQGSGNSFTLANTDEVAVVPRERRPPQDVAAVFGSHGSHNQVVAEVQRTYDLWAAVADATSRAWPDGTGPQDEIRALDRAVRAIDDIAKGVDGYRANAAAMEAAAAAAQALYGAADDDMLNRYVGLPLHRLHQHLDVQAQRLHADVAYLTERAATATTVEAPTASESDTDANQTVSVTEGQATVKEAQAEGASAGEEDTPPAPPEPAIDLAAPPTLTSDAPESLQQSEQRFGGPEQLAQYAGRADIIPTSETEQLGLFDDPAQDLAEGPDDSAAAAGSDAVSDDETPAQPENSREAQLRAALVEGETIAPVSFTDQRKPASGWILTTAAGHTFRLRPVTHALPGADHWEAGHDADGSYWWKGNVEDWPLAAVLERIREDSATRTRFAALWDRYGHLTAQAPPFETTTERVQLEEGVYLVRRFGCSGLIASCRWGWEHLTGPDGAQGHTGEDWNRRNPDKRQYVAEWKVWSLAQEAIPNARLRVVSQLTNDMADTPDAYCDASAPYVGKCSPKRSGARYTVAVLDDEGSELGSYTMCARCLSHRLLSDEDRHIAYDDVRSLVESLAKGDPKVVDLHWKQWPDRIAELAGQMLSAALDAGETAPWPAQALTSQILTEACEAGDDRAAREARAEVKSAGGAGGGAEAGGHGSGRSTPGPGRAGCPARRGPGRGGRGRPRGCRRPRTRRLAGGGQRRGAGVCAGGRARGRRRQCAGRQPSGPQRRAVVVRVHRHRSRADGR